MKRLSLLISIAVTLGFATGASASIRPADPEPPLMCTEIGCESGLYASLSGLRSAFPNAKRVKVCVADRCRLVRRSRLDLVIIRGIESDSPGKLNVRFVAYGKKGKVLGKDRIRADVRKNQPNGEFCPPICFQVSVYAEDDGRLVESPVSG